MSAHKWYDFAGIFVVGRDWFGNDLPNLELRNGTPCTVMIGSDRYADKVSKITRSGRHILLEQNGIWSRRKDGRYRPVGGHGNSGYRIVFGFADDYRDPSF